MSGDKVRVSKVMGKWYVQCPRCEPGGYGFLSMMLQPLGVAEEHGAAMVYANAHATLHDDVACQHCGTDKRVTLDDTKALVNARTR